MTYPKYLEPEIYKDLAEKISSKRVSVSLY